MREPNSVLPADRIKNAVSDLLVALSERFGFDLKDPNFQDTPQRVANAYEEILSGYKEDAGQILSVNFPSGNYDQMIVVKDIKFYSICAHHMLPFYGFAAVGYIPTMVSSNQRKGPIEVAKVIGLSKIARVVHCYAKRFQIQERMTEQIATAINNMLMPRGVGVYIYSSVHLCMHMRGIEESHATMETSALYGDFRSDQSVREEFFSLVRNKNAAS